MTAKEMTKSLYYQTLDLMKDGIEHVSIEVQPITKSFNTRCQNILNEMHTKLDRVYDSHTTSMTYDEYMMKVRAIISVKYDIAKAISK